jgi:hypothetical protein
MACCTLSGCRALAAEELQEQMKLDLGVMLARKFGYRGACRIAIGRGPVAPSLGALRAEMRIQRLEYRVPPKPFATFVAEAVKLRLLVRAAKMGKCTPQLPDLFGGGARPIDESVGAIILRSFSSKQSGVGEKRVEE